MSDRRIVRSKKGKKTDRSGEVLLAILAGGIGATNHALDGDGRPA